MFLCILPVSTSIYLPFRNTEGTAKRVETHKEGQRPLAKAGRTIYPTMGFLKARPLQINSVACISHLLQVKTGAR